MSKVQKVLDIYKRYGFSGFFNKLSEKLQAPYRDYGKRIAEYLPTEEELDSQRTAQKAFASRPLISVIVPTYETSELFLTDLLDSLRNQTYPKWELVLADGSKSDTVKRTVDAYRKRYPEFGTGESELIYRKLSENKGISGNTNEGIALAKGTYLAFLDHDDVLTENALFENVLALNEKPYRLLYSDEDKGNADLSSFSQPHFKKDFDLEFLRTNNYICHFLVAEASLVREIGGFRSGYDGSQDYDLILRLIEELIYPEGSYDPAGREEIHHIGKILYHWRMHDASTAGNSSSKTYTMDAGLRAVKDHFERLSIDARVEERIEVGCYRITYGGGTDVKARFSLAEGLVPRNEDWQERLLRTLSQGDVCAVCGKTYLPDGRVDQAGVRKKPEGNEEKLFHGLKGSFKGYERRAVLRSEADAVCMDFAAVRTDYEEGKGRIVFDPDVEADWTSNP